MFANALRMKLCCCCCWVASVVSDSVRPHRQQPPGSPVPGILQARTLEWVAISFFNAWKWKVKVKSLSRVGLLATPRTAAYQTPPSMGFSRQEYWSGVPIAFSCLEIRAWLRFIETGLCELIVSYLCQHLKINSVLNYLKINVKVLISNWQWSPET